MPISHRVTSSCCTWMQDSEVDGSSSRQAAHSTVQPLNKDVGQQNARVGYRQAGQVDAGRQLAHARRAEHSEGYGVADDSDEDDTRSDVRVEVLAAVQKLQVGLHAAVTT